MEEMPSQFIEERNFIEFELESKERSLAGFSKIFVANGGLLMWVFVC